MVETTNSKMEEEVMKVKLLAKKRELESNLNSLHMTNIQEEMMRR
jgi:hypothetical protein